LFETNLVLLILPQVLSVSLTKMSLSFRKKSKKSDKSEKGKPGHEPQISGPVNLRQMRTTYATSLKELSPDEIQAYKAKMIEKYEKQQDELRNKPLQKPQPDPKKILDTSGYQKLQQHIVGDVSKLRKVTMLAIQGHANDDEEEIQESKQNQSQESQENSATWKPASPRGDKQQSVIHLKEKPAETPKEAPPVTPQKVEEPPAKKAEESPAQSPKETQPEEKKEETEVKEPATKPKDDEGVEVIRLPELFPDIQLKDEEKKNIEEVEKRINEVNEKWNIPFEELEFSELVASGASGEVHLGYLSGLAVAIKKIHVTNKKERKLVDREYSLLRRVTHPNIVKFLGVCDHSSGFFLITEYIAHGDLFDLLNFGDKENFTWKDRISISIQIASACEYLHSVDIIHRDLKSQNVLIGDTNYLVKLCDFGFATALQERTKRYLTTCGTEEWLAPEIALEDAYDHKVDLFSFGLVLTELIMCRPPRKRKIKENLAFNVGEFEKDLPEECPREYAQLVVDCTQFRPDDRPEFRDVVVTLSKLMETVTN